MIERRYKPGRIALQAAVTVAVGLMLGWLLENNSFSEAANRVAARVFLPILTLDYRSAAHDKVTVLTLDDDDLREAGLTWPVGMDYYQRLLDRLVVAKPRAVFIDVLFIDDRPKATVDRFAQSACAATRAGVPVYLASLAQQRTTSPSFKRLASAEIDGKPCFILVAPNAEIDAHDRSAWSYPLQVQPPGGAEAVATPAHRMACDLYQVCPKNLSESMALVWPGQGSPVNEAMHQRLAAHGGTERSCAGAVSKRERVAAPFQAMLGRSPDLPVCASTVHIPMRALNGVGLTEAERDALLTGRTILVGTSLQSTGDLAVTPQGRSVPGVLVHAMALDNLLTLGDGYPRNKAPWAFVFISLALVAFGSALWQAFPWWPASSNVGYLNPATLPAKPVGCTRRLALTAWLATRHALSLGNWPVGEGDPTLWQRGCRVAAGGALALMGMALIFCAGKWFAVGPVASIEFILLPLGAEFLHVGQRVTRLLCSAWESAGYLSPVEAFRGATGEARRG